MESKLKRYNQKILAAIGTLALIALSFMIFVGAYFFIEDLIRDNRRIANEDNALQVNMPADTTVNQSRIRKQELSFSNPKLIDTLKNIYLIPVSQVNLKQPEVINQEGPAEAEAVMIDGYSGRRKLWSKGSYSYYSYSGSYNNIILYYKTEAQKISVFDEKVNINSFKNFILNDKQYLFIHGSRYDSNKDGKLNQSDLQSFFLYSIEDRQLETIEFEKSGLVDYYIMFDTDEIILQFGKDKDGDGEFNKYLEPIYLKKYTISEKKSEDLIEQDLIDKLQSLIE